MKLGAKHQHDMPSSFVFVLRRETFNLYKLLTNIVNNRFSPTTLVFGSPFLLSLYTPTKHSRKIGFPRGLCHQNGRCYYYCCCYTPPLKKRFKKNVKHICLGWVWAPTSTWHKLGLKLTQFDENLCYNDEMLSTFTASLLEALKITILWKRTEAWFLNRNLKSFSEHFGWILDQIWWKLVQKNR